MGHDINTDREVFASCLVCPFIAPFIQFYMPHNLDIASKVTTLATKNTFFFADRLLRLQTIFRVAKIFHCGRKVALQKLVTAGYDM